MDDVSLFITLAPSVPYFPHYARDQRLAGIRLNSAMLSVEEIVDEYARLEALGETVPVFFDAKGRQLRIETLNDNPDFLDITLNHAISVQTPTQVLFKAGEDGAVLDHLEEGGKRLIFQGGPKYRVKPGESLHLRHPSLRIKGAMFTDIEKEKLEATRLFGVKRYFLSFVHSQEYIDEFLELVGNDVEVYLKIEDLAGLEFVATKYRKRPGQYLVVARGDLYVEVDRPHDILAATRLIIEKDPEACVGSRILLSCVQSEVPSCADFSELAWLYDIGFRKMLLCDDLCIHEELLATAVNAFDCFRENYPPRASPAAKQLKLIA